MKFQSFGSDAKIFRLVSEAYRISAAHLIEPFLAVRLSLIEPLPHQISAVYEKMLPRQPLRFVLADDPGAGKTVMTGLHETFSAGATARQNHAAFPAFDGHAAQRQGERFLSVHVAD